MSYIAPFPNCRTVAAFFFSLSVLLQAPFLLVFMLANWLIFEMRMPLLFQHVQVNLLRLPKNTVSVCLKVTLFFADLVNIRYLHTLLFWRESVPSCYERHRAHGPLVTHGQPASGTASKWKLAERPIPSTTQGSWGEEGLLTRWLAGLCTGNSTRLHTLTKAFCSLKYEPLSPGHLTIISIYVLWLYS